jgi:hypothetical protein
MQTANIARLTRSIPGVDPKRQLGNVRYTISGLRSRALCVGELFFCGMYFPDLSHYVYGRTFPEAHILNVAWLSKEHPYQQGPSPEWLVGHLRDRIAQPVNLYRGSHACEFCPEPPTKELAGGIEIRDYPKETLGNGEIRVRALDGKIYVAPVLILHYIECHGYLPPRVFIEAVAADLPQPVLRDGVWR